MVEEKVDTRYLWAFGGYVVGATVVSLIHAIVEAVS